LRERDGVWPPPPLLHIRSHSHLGVIQLSHVEHSKREREGEGGGERERVLPFVVQTISRRVKSKSAPQQKGQSSQFVQCLGSERVCERDSRVERERERGLKRKE
jgi:hypothetical protein